jgi:glucosylceramidase
MIRSLHASFGIGLALFMGAACGTSDPDTQGTTTGQAGSPTTGTSGAATTGTSGAATTGTSGAGTTGTSGAATTGTSGAGAGVSGSGALPTGGSTSTAGASATAGDTGAGGSTGQAGTAGTGGGGTVPPVSLPEGVVTSANGAFWKAGTLTPSTSGTVDVTANDTSAKQRWDGFGGTFNEAGWDALAVLTDAERLQALKLLFDAADGANFAYGRLPIGASDYSMKRYTLAETANDFEMKSFTIEQDKKLLIPYVKAALAIKPDIHLWSSPWTPPAWMKTNNSTDSGNMKDDDAVLKAFALYLEKYVQAYAAEGLKIEAVHPQNEPGYGTNPYPCAGWSSALYIKFIRDYLGPQFQKDNVPAEIWCGTMSNESDGTIATTLANDSKAMSYVKGFGLQWNTRGVVGTLKSKGSVMQTEHKCGNYDFDTENKASPYDPNKPQNDFAYGVESWKNIKAWIDAGVNSYSAWNMVLDTLGTNLNASKPWHQNALLVVDRGAKKLTATPAYYVFRHLSQYVSPKATVIGTTGGDALAFKNPDGKLVVVMYNSGGAKMATVSLGGTKFSFDMPANGWATVYHAK